MKADQYVWRTEAGLALQTLKILGSVNKVRQGRI